MVWLISLTILRRESMPPRSKNLLGSPIIEVTIGHHKLNQEYSLMVCLLLDLKMQNKCYILLMEIRKRKLMWQKCTERPMATSVQVSKNQETIIGIESVWNNLTIDLVMENKKFSMELPSQFIMRGLNRLSPRQL